MSLKGVLRGDDGVVAVLQDLVLMPERGLGLFLAVVLAVGPEPAEEVVPADEGDENEEDGAGDERVSGKVVVIFFHKRGFLCKNS